MIITPGSLKYNDSLRDGAAGKRQPERTQTKASFSRSVGLLRRCRKLGLRTVQIMVIYHSVISERMDKKAASCGLANCSGNAECTSSS